MKKTLGLFAVVLALGLTAVADAEAKRLGGARSSGMQRQQMSTPAQSPATAPTQAAPAANAAAPAAAGAAAAASKRSWMGPVAGLAAGLGLAALASHFGFGEALANMMMIALLVMLALVVVGFVLRKRAAAAAHGTPAAAGAAGMGGTAQPNVWRNDAPVQAPRAAGGSLIGSRLGGASTAPVSGAPGHIPADFDAASFARNAQAQFMALQAANDARDLQRLREYLTPEMFEVVREEIATRGDAVQATEVFGLQAQVLDVAEEGTQYVVSVRFTGSVREQPGAQPEDLDEVWHLAKPRFGAGGWVVAGIQQAS